MRSSSGQISASPARTVNTSSTSCECVGAPAPGATHCSKMQSCAAPLAAATIMRVSTPSRQCSGTAVAGSLMIMNRLPEDEIKMNNERAAAMLTCISLSHGPFMTHSADRVALITGAARGIGLATAKRFLAEGWRVALLDIEDKLLQGAVAA